MRAEFRGSAHGAGVVRVQTVEVLRGVCYGLSERRHQLRLLYVLGFQGVRLVLSEQQGGQGGPPVQGLSPHHLDTRKNTTACMRHRGGARGDTEEERAGPTAVTDLVQTGVERYVVAVVELRLLVQDISQVLVSLGFQRLLRQHPSQPHGFSEKLGSVPQLARQVRQGVENGRGVLRRYELLLLGPSGNSG